MSGPPRRASSGSFGGLGAQRLFAKHRVQFSPPDLLRWFLQGPLGLEEAQGIHQFESVFVTFPLLVELGEGAVIDTAARHFWVESGAGLAIDRPTVVYGGTASVRASFALVLTAIDGARAEERRYPVAVTESEREALLELTILRTRHARDSIIPR